MNKHFVISAVVCATAFFCGAQQQQGTITYSVAAASDYPEMYSQVENYDGGQLSLSFHETALRSTLKWGGYFSRSTINRKGCDSTLVLTDNGVEQKAVFFTKEDLPAEQRLALSKRNVELVDEAKRVLNRDCKKAIVTSADSRETIIWYAPSILPPVRKGDYLFHDIPGAPLEIITSKGKMELHFLAEDIHAAIDDEKNEFQMVIPEGFEEHQSLKVNPFTHEH
ncbi:MAG: hypothetical protein ACQERC_13200 [Bacteroidota bacterium]